MVYFCEASRGGATVRVYQEHTLLRKGYDRHRREGSGGTLLGQRLRWYMPVLASSLEWYSVICVCPSIRPLCKATIRDGIKHAYLRVATLTNLCMDICHFRERRDARESMVRQTTKQHTCGHPLSFRISVAKVKYPYT
jgi:hypothetical protein